MKRCSGLFPTIITFALAQPDNQTAQRHQKERKTTRQEKENKTNAPDKARRSVPLQDSQTTRTLSHIEKKKATPN